MTINGREIKFRRTVLGNCKIAEICPGKDINQFSALIEGDYPTAQTAAATFVAALSEGYEMWREFEEPGYKGRPVMQAEVMLLDSDDFNNLFAEALSVFSSDGKTTVEAEAPKSGKKEEAAGSD